jgi:hypothetical protein
MKKELNKIAMKSKVKPICVFIKPCVEKQDLNFVETFTGTPKQIISRSIEIIKGLESVFKNADFSVKIEKLDLTQTLYLDSGIFFDNDFNEVANIEDYLSI